MNFLRISSLGALAAAALLATGASASELVTNGGFETGDFTGWTINAVSFPIYIVDGSNGPVEAGLYSAQIAGFNFGPDTIAQNIADVAGDTYQLSFWRWQDPAVPNGLDVTWNGVSVFSETDNLDGAGYQQFTATVTGTGLDALVFAAYNDPAYTYVDDISLTGRAAVPEPATWAMMLVGFGGLGAMMRRRRAAVFA